jgi:hypothetical protein
MKEKSSLLRLKNNVSMTRHTLLYEKLPHEDG